MSIKTAQFDEDFPVLREDNGLTKIDPKVRFVIAEGGRILYKFEKGKEQFMAKVLKDSGYDLEMIFPNIYGDWIVKKVK